jgi:hypothetical protein
MTRDLILWGWVVTLALIVGTEVGARRSHGRFGTLGVLRDRATAPVAVYLVLLVGWMWLGWHFFAR